MVYYSYNIHVSHWQETTLNHEEGGNGYGERLSLRCGQVVGSAEYQVVETNTIQVILDIELKVPIFTNMILGWHIA